MGFGLLHQIIPGFPIFNKLDPISQFQLLYIIYYFISPITMGFQSPVFLTSLISAILFRCPHHFILCALIYSKYLLLLSTSAICYYFWFSILPYTELVQIQGVPGGMCQTSGECSLGQTIPIWPKTPISKVQWLRIYWPEKSVDFFGVCIVYSVRNVIRLTFTATILQ